MITMKLVTWFLNNITAPQIGFDPAVYDFNEDTGIATLFIVTNVPDLVDAGGTLFYTTEGTATSSGGIVRHTIKRIDGSGLDSHTRERALHF